MTKTFLSVPQNEDEFYEVKSPIRTFLDSYDFKHWKRSVLIAMTIVSIVLVLVAAVWLLVSWGRNGGFHLYGSIFTGCMLLAVLMGTLIWAIER